MTLDTRARQFAESVWDYPRPPRLEPSARHLQVMHAGITIADTRRSLRILETSHPPVYYFPPADVAAHLLVPSQRRGSFCEFKGVASYWSIAAADPEDEAVEAAAWSYAHPSAAYAGLKDYFAFYASRVDECRVDGELVVAQPGDFYGGWITSHVRGPFKGAPGTLGW